MVKCQVRKPRGEREGVTTELSPVLRPKSSSLIRSFVGRRTTREGCRYPATNFSPGDVSSKLLAPGRCSRIRGMDLNCRDQGPGLHYEGHSARASQESPSREAVPPPPAIESHAGSEKWEWSAGKSVWPKNFARIHHVGARS